MTMTQDQPFHIRILSRPGSLLVSAFAGLILVGAILLSLPFTHATDRVGPLDALFTATSAVCVTGLIVVDTGGDFNRVGQTVILILIQLGGLGIMTFAALVLQIAGHRLSFRSQAALADVLYQRNAAAVFRRNLKWIVLLALVIEAVGSLLLYRSLTGEACCGSPAYVATFHAVSAFCNAGFSTFSDSLTSLGGNLGFMTVVTVLIVLGGLGYTVLFEIIGRSWRRLRRQPGPVHWSLHSRVVLATSLVLVLLGAIALDILGGTGDDTRIAARAGHALFQSVSARTAGFNTMDISALPLASLLWLAALMFVGGSPGSCAGGIKTTSVAIWLARLRARLLQREDVTIGRRRIPVDLVRRTGLLIGTAAVYNIAGIMILAITEAGRPGADLKAIVFEQISAFATVGLSTGLTPALTVAGKLWIIVTMFVGRLGPLTIALVMMDRRTPAVRMAEERLMIG